MCDTNSVIPSVIVQYIKGDKRDVTSSVLLLAMPNMYNGPKKTNKKKTLGEGQKLPISGKNVRNPLTFTCVC